MHMQLNPFLVQKRAVMPVVSMSSCACMQGIDSIASAQKCTVFNRVMSLHACILLLPCARCVPEVAQQLLMLLRYLACCIWSGDTAEPRLRVSDSLADSQNTKRRPQGVGHTLT